MKKLLTAIVLITTITSAHALPTVIPAGHAVPPSSAYQAGYNSGYDNGKQDAYHNVAKTVFITAVVVVAGTIIYQLGKESRWTANESGVVYRF